MADKPTGILVCAILFAIGGSLIILGGLLMLLLEAIITSAIIIIGVVLLAVAYGIWKMKKWAKIAGIILAIIVGALVFPNGTIIALVILYFLLIDRNTKDSFTE